MNLTLVALYGPKPQALVDLFSAVQAEIRNQLGDAFTPYAMDQIHATLVGLEGTRTGEGVLNNNLVNTERTPRSMDLEGLFRFLFDTPLLPLTIRIGGFSQFAAYPFTSRGQHPYVRSFSLRREEAVVIGWPAGEHNYPVSLDRLRRRCADYNVLHKYHQCAGDIDNDLFLVLGHLRRDCISSEEHTAVEYRVREMLSSRQPLDFTIDAQTLSVVAYEDRTLPTASSFRYPLPEVRDNVDFLADFYVQQ